MSVPPIPDLGTLIADNRGEGKAVTTSFRDLALAAGGKPTATRFHQLRKRGVIDPATGDSDLNDWPEAASIPGIAQALGVSEWAVIRSAAVSLGFTPPPDASDTPLLARLARLPLDKLTASEVETIVGMARALLADR